MDGPSNPSPPAITETAPKGAVSVIECRGQDENLGFDKIAGSDFGQRRAATLAHSASNPDLPAKNKELQDVFCNLAVFRLNKGCYREDTLPREMVQVTGV